MRSNKDIVITILIAIFISSFITSLKGESTVKVIKDYGNTKIVKRNLQIFYITDKSEIDITDWQ